jgi:hypothetical protein
MGLVPPAVEIPSAAESHTSRPGDRARWLVLSGYLLAAVVLTWRLWASPAGRVQAGDPHDIDLFAWYMRYAATAISHGRLPALFTTALNAPTGVSVMWNTSLLLPGMLLSPVTLLAGPQASLTVLLTLGFAGSAASLFWVLRRWRASTLAAALGGAVYGFSPALVNSGIGHYHLVLAAAAPLIIDAMLRIVIGRGSTIRNGVWLGVLAAAQVFVSEEMLVDTALAGLALVLALVAGHPRAVAGRVRAVALGLAVSLAVALVICGYALWVQLAGPQREHSVLGFSWATNPAFFVDPAGTMLFHTSAGAAAANAFHLGVPEVLAYLGWPLIVVLVAAAIRFWREPSVRAAAVTFVVLALCSLGGGGQRYFPPWLLPWHWIQGLPGLAQVLPNRFSILADGAAATTGAFALDLARSAPSRAARWPGRAVPVMIAALAVLPLIPLPYQAVGVTQVPAGWQAAFGRLRLAPDARVLVVPIPNVGHTYAMRWQADTGEPGSLIGGFFLGPDSTGQAIFDPGPARSIDKYLDFLWDGRYHVTSRSAAQIRPALAFWRPAAVVAVVRPRSQLAGVLIELFGRPTFRVGGVLAWRL